MRIGFVGFVLFIVSAFSLSVAQTSQEGVLGSPNTNRSINSMADWYTAKILTSYTTVITVSTTYSRLLLKGFYNPRTDSTIRVLTITQAGDTVPYTIPTSSFTGKVPRVTKIIGASDSTGLLFQYQ